MNQERWQLLWRIYGAAEALPASEWLTFVESQTNDAQLRLTLLAMLRDPQNTFGSMGATPRNSLGARLTPGDTIGRYRVTGMIGQGGMSDVYTAYDAELERTVALKLVAPKPDSAGNAEAVLREARAASALNHPNIVTIYEVLPFGRGLVLVMELVDGAPIRRCPGDSLSPSQLALYGEQIARALAAAHHAGLIHGDIKPENIMLRPDGYIKLVDFGLARSLSALVDAELPGGSLLYLSPELVRGLPHGPPSDVFSLGLVLAELALARHPFARPTRLASLSAIANESPLLPEKSPLTPLLRQMLAKNPLDRPTATAVADRLAGLARPPKTPSWSAPSRRAVIKALCAASILVPVGWLLQAQRRRSPSQWEESPLANLPGEESAPAFSPNGRNIAFVFRGDRDWHSSIYLKSGAPSGAQDVIRLTAHPAEEANPCWSPDGRSLGFLRERHGLWSVLVRPVDGGSELVYGAIADRGHSFSLLTWLPDQSGLLVADVSIPGGASLSLYSLFPDGRRVRLTTPPAARSDAVPRFSPDGRTLAFFRFGENGLGELCVMPFPDGQTQPCQLPPGDFTAYDWTPDSQSLLVQISNQGVHRLYALPLSGAEPILRQELPQPALALSIAPKGGRLAYQTARLTDANIWRYPLEGNDGPRQFIASARFEADPQISPDGSQIAFLSTRGDRSQIWVCSSDGSNPSPVTAFGPGHRLTGSPSWSPDGLRLAFDTRDEGGLSWIGVVNRDGSGLRRLSPVPSRGGNAFVPRWSHDGRWIYFASDQEKRLELWRLPSTGGSPIRFTQEGGFEAFAEPTGRYVYFSKGWEVAGLWRQPTTGGAATFLPELSPIVRHRYWQGTADGIWFVNALASQPVADKPLADKATIQFYSFASSRVRNVLPAPRPMVPRYHGLSISPDGRYFLYLQQDIRRSEVRVVETDSLSG